MWLKTEVSIKLKQVSGLMEEQYMAECEIPDLGNQLKQPDFISLAARRLTFVDLFT